MNLADLILAGRNGAPMQLATGIVTQASPLLVQVGGATAGTAAVCLTSYTPVVDDFVVVLVQGATRVVLGTVSL